MTEKAVVLHPGKDKAVRNRHHWIFSGAVASWPEFENGEVLPVRGSGGDLLGYAYFNRESSISGRMIGFGKTPPEEALRANLESALEWRRRFFDEERTNAFRLVNAEGDGLPGLIVDKYGDVLVFQIATLGMDKLKPLVLDIISATLRPRSILEKSNLPVRREEGLPEFEGVLSGEAADRVQILENGLPFWVDFRRSQKTGFYLDLREMRSLVRETARGRRVLNVFAYTGAFSVCALKGGALSADSVETSEPALALAEDNFELNGLSTDSGLFFAADAHQFLREADRRYDYIILDPPAFAKKRADVVAACRAYKDINRLALQKILPGGLVLTFSCSHFVDEALFQKVLFQAAQEAGRRVRILQKHHQAYDHPINIYHPETHYLKGFLLGVD